LAIWKVIKQDGKVKLTYVSGGSTKECGAGPVALEQDLLAWVAESSEVWDVIAIDGMGMFAKVCSPPLLA
jgi:hypothetical protein